MANGTYVNGGIDLSSDSDGLVNNVLSGPITITKTGDGGGANNDPLVLDTGDTFEISSLPSVTFIYSGTDGSGGILAVGAGLGGDVLWLSDSVITVGNAVPALVVEQIVICFAPGTFIATPDGETVVEALGIGDLITTADGDAVPVKWIGRQTVHKMFAGERARPVRVAAGALGDGLPHTNLVLTADHALVIDGLAINASALVNGTTISFDPIESLPEQVTYYHIETEHHDVILANGVPAETYVDYVGRCAFDNYREYADLYGEERAIREMDLPRISSARLLPPSIKARLSGSAAAA